MFALKSITYNDKQKLVLSRDIEPLTHAFVWI